MKLRLKISGQSQQIDLGDTDASSVTLGALKASVSETFLIEHRNVELSLNKKDILTGDETSIADLGIVPGDLIHVISGGDEPQNLRAAAATRRPQPLASHSAGSGSSAGVVGDDQLNSNQHNADNDDDDNGMPSVVTTSDQAAWTAGSNSSQEDRMEVGGSGSQIFQRSLSEPLVIRESTANQVPALLQELYSCSDITSPNDALFVLLNALMIESGFFLPDDADVTCLPPNWKRPGYFLCCYQFVLTPGMVSECSLMAVPTGSSMAVHGLSKTVGNFKTDHLQLKAENFVRDITQENAAAAYRSLDRLSTVFKDTVGLALQNHLATSAGFRETQGLLSLPCEVKMRLMCFLDAPNVCSLGQTCQQWKSIYKDNTVWRRLYIQSFDRPSDTSLSRNWYELFKKRYQEFIEQRLARERFSIGSEDDFIGFPFPHLPFDPRPFPQFMGGYHDLNPHFGPAMQNGRFGRHGPPPNRFANQGQGRLGGRGRGNLAGSPFFHNGFY